MITNHLLLKLKNSNSENINCAVEALRSMAGRIEYLQAIEVHTDILHNQMSYDILMVARYNSMQDFNAYLTHPVHVEVATYIGTVVEQVASVCYESNQ
ncbi:MAG: Dabb family protein [Sedimentisphaerales bacterium]|nr:Dabb family protein [Sedimentisphaerales bacterium]